MTKIIITLGLPAAGKNTFIELMGIDKKYKMFDVDEYSKNFKVDHSEGKKIMLSELKEYVADFPSDNIMLVAASGSENFEETLKYFMYRHYEITIIYFEVDKEISILRNSNRYRKVPLDIIERAVKLLPDNLVLAKKYAKYFYKISHEELHNE